MRAALLIACSLAVTARAQIDLRAPDDRLEALENALALETAGEMIVSTPSISPCVREAASRWRSVCVEIRGTTLYVLVQAPDGRTRDAALGTTATNRTVAVVAGSLLGELAMPGSAPSVLPGRYFDTERPPSARPSRAEPEEPWRVIGQVGIGAALVTSSTTTALGPSFGGGLGVEAPIGLRIGAFADGAYPVAIADQKDLWIVRGGLAIGMRINLGPAALHLDGRVAAGFTPQRYDFSRYAIVPLVSGGAVVGVGTPLDDLDVLIAIGLEIMQRGILDRPIELVTSLGIVSEFR